MSAMLRVLGEALPAQPSMVMSTASQVVIAAIVAGVALVAALYAWALWARGRRLRQGSDALTKYWRALEKALVEHHQAAEDLVRTADEAGAVRRRERERAESAVASATLTGSPSQRARREQVLHGAMEELRHALDGRPVAATDRVRVAQDAYDASWEQVLRLGEGYTTLVHRFNRVVGAAGLRMWNRRLGWEQAQTFDVGQQATTAQSIDVL